jgi:murein DD-endopeptidase MepM/ murein hydrolase activator NlpD
MFFLAVSAEESTAGRFEKVVNRMVKVGDKVKRGQVIGLCGNSGNSSEPHLHYHLQNTPIIQDGTGIKCYYQKVIVLENGKKQSKTNYSPIKGETIVAD